MVFHTYYTTSTRLLRGKYHFCAEKGGQMPILSINVPELQ